MRRLALLAVIAACGTKSGIELVVTPPSVPIDKVAVFVGVGSEHKDAIAPEGFTRPVAGSTWWTRDQMNELDVVTDVAGKKSIVFAYQPGATSTLSIVVAVGYANDQPVAAALIEDVQMPSGYVARYPLALKPIADPRQMPDQFGLELWANDGCAFIVDPSDGSKHMIVTEGDRDCDGFANDDAKECDAHVYDARIGPGLDKIHCLQHETITQPTGTTLTACVLGGDVCKDGMGWTPGCVSSGFCVPNSDCAGCQNLPDENARFHCVSDITTASPDTMARVECKLRPDPDHPGEVCPNGLEMFPTRPLPNRTCTGPVKIAHAGGPFASSVTIGTMKFDLSDINTACDFTVTPSGQWPVGTSELAAIVASPLDNGRGAAIPVLFTLDTSITGPCPTTPTVPCTLLSLDVQYGQCVDAAPIPP